MNTVRYHEKDIPLYDGYDTVVVGGGSAGSAAAIRSAQLGCRTLVVEKFTTLGGTAVNALVTPMMNSEVEHYPLFGQIKDRLQAYGLQTGHRYNKSLWFGPEDMARCLEELLTEAGGEVLYDACLTDVVTEDGRIRFLVVFAEGRTMAVSGESYVDATGDAVLSRLAGVAVVSGDKDGNNQCSSLRFEMGGVDVERYREYCKEIGDTFSPMVHRGEFFESAMVGGRGFKLEPLFRKGVEDGVLQEEDLRYYQCFTVPGKPGCMSFNCPHIAELARNTSPWARSRAMIRGHQMIRRLCLFLQRYMPGFEQAFLLRVAPMLGVRESYRIVGKYVLTEQDYLARARFPDGIVKGDWYIDVHDSNNKSIEGHSYQPGEYYEIPYRCLVNDKIDNMITIGRCISTTFLMQSSIRIQPTLIDMGYAAGEACSYAKEHRVPLGKLNGQTLRTK